MQDEIEGFVEGLKATMRRGLEHGSLETKEIEALLHSPDFDPTAFDTFLAEARRLGIQFREEASHEAHPAPEATPGPDHSIGDLERRYLAEIQRYPLLRRDAEQALWAAMRGGD